MRSLKPLLALLPQLKPPPLIIERVDIVHLVGLYEYTPLLVKYSAGRHQATERTTSWVGRRQEILCPGHIFRMLEKRNRKI